jgi:hypothetical protein
MDFFVLDNQEPFDAAVYRDPGYLPSLDGII